MLVPAFMKKGRPGHWLVVVAEPSISEQLAGLILASTSTLGVRVREERRIELARTIEVVQTAFGEVAVKVATLADGSRRAHAEYESVRAVAVACGRPPREVAGAAEAAWRALSPDRPSIF